MFLAYLQGIETDTGSAWVQVATLFLAYLQGIETFPPSNSLINFTLVSSLPTRDWNPI